MTGLLAGVGGCAAPTPGERVVDPAAGTQRRVQSVADWRPDPNDDAATRRLARTLWSDREPRALRLAVLDALATHAPQTLWRSARRGLAGVGDPQVVAALAQRAADDDVRSLVGTLVRRWARPAGEAVFGPAPGPRAEAAAVVRLTGQSEHDALRAVLQNDPWDANAAAAWTLLNDPARGFDARQWAANAARSVPASEAAQTLARWAPVLDVMPTNSEQVRGLKAWFAAPLPETEAAGTAIRHLPLLAVLRETGPRGTRPSISRRLAGTTHVPRRSDRTSDHSPGFDPAALSAMDRRALHETLDAFATPAVVAALFEQADADQADPTTEHGGGLLRDPLAVAWRAAPYPSAKRRNDLTYITPPGLIEAMYHRGLAHYHFHAQRHRHADYAGPGPGDLDFAAHSGLLCLTLTFIDSNHLNVDATLPDGTVIDLGCIRRP